MVLDKVRFLNDHREYSHNKQTQIMNTIKESKMTTNLQHIDKSEVEQTLDRFGMNWTVDKKPLQFF